MSALIVLGVMFFGFLIVVWKVKKMPARRKADGEPDYHHDVHID